MSKYGVFSGPYFPSFGLDTEIYGVNLRIQSKYKKIRTRKNSVLGHFSRRDGRAKAKYQNPKAHSDRVISVVTSAKRTCTLNEKNCFERITIIIRHSGMQYKTTNLLRNS